MKVFYIDASELGIYPIGFCAIIVAKDIEEADLQFRDKANLEGIQLMDSHFNKKDYTIHELNTNIASCNIVVNGNY